MNNRALLTLEFMPSVGGIERLLHERSKNFNPHSTYVLTPKVPHDLKFDNLQNYHVIRTPIIRLPFLKRICQFFGPALYFLSLRKKLSLSEIECGQAFPFPIFAMWMKKILNIDYIVWVHGNDLIRPIHIPFVGWLIKKSLSNATKIIANSNFVSQLIQSYGIDKNKIYVHSKIIDTTIFYPKQPSELLKTRYFLNDHKVILSIGRLVERKGFDSVIACLPALLQKHKLKYIIVGTGPYLPDLKKRTLELNLQDCVIFSGEIPFEELPLHYHIANVFVMVSKYLVNKSSVEGLGLVYLEASASKIPVVGGNAGGVADAVQNGITGLLVDPNNQEQIKNAIDRILSDSELAKNLGEAGYNFANQPAEWEKLAMK